MAKQKRISTELTNEIEDMDRVSSDATIATLRADITALKARYKKALHSIEDERQRANSLASLKNIKPKKYKTRKTKGGKNNCTMVLLLSDWHCEERVDPDTVNGVNEFSLEIADKRIDELQQRFLMLLEHERQIANIDRVVVWLGGDFFSGHIHEDTAELAQLAPLSAVRWAGARIRNTLDLVSDSCDQVIVTTSAGNHGRSNFGKPRIGTELEHSFEQHLYLTMESAEHRENINWHVGHGHLNYLNLDGFKIRFHHGHSYKFQGGQSGIHAPVSKGNSQWDHIEPCDLTCFGHWHQWGWHRQARYVSNGSLIGQSAYALTKVKSGESPCQAAVVIDHKRHEVTRAYPIFTDRDQQFLRKR